jgi:hypothetical protein
MNVYSDYIKNMTGKILLGCDGFVDETYEVVQVRESQTAYTPMQHVKQFGELIVERGEGGVGVELVFKRRCEGGFGINSGRIAACLGIKPLLPGLYGKDQLDPAFEAFQETCEMASLGDPALTIAYEFQDGKILMSDLAAVSNLKWSDFEAHFSADQIREMFSDVDILGLGYWSLTGNFDDLFQGFMKQYETLDDPGRMFFDFADIKKKSTEAFLRSLKLIQSVSDRIPLTLSMNEHEGNELFSRLGVDQPEQTPEGFVGALSEARAKIGFDELIIHTANVACASTATEGEAIAIQERQTNVVRLAGAGDSFNGGYLCASLGDLPLKNRLVLANAATAYFVTHGTRPTRDELIAQIEKAKDK